jgi:hypothetical protein
MPIGWQTFSFLTSQSLDAAFPFTVSVVFVTLVALPLLLARIAATTRHTIHPSADALSSDTTQNCQSLYGISAHPRSHLA